MNAYELANEIDACFTKADWNVLEAANMLRQQADYIKQLEDSITKTQLALVEAVKKEKLK